MPKIKVNDELVIEVDKNFFNLSPSEKNKIVDDAVVQDAIEGAGRAFASGMLFNFRDEIVSILSEPTAAISEFMGDAEAGAPFRAELTRQRALESAFRQQQPATSVASEIAGGLATPAGVLGLAAKAPTLAGRLIRGVASGAGMGALGGAGAAEEGQRLQGAGVGARVGAVAAPIAMAAAPVAKAVTAPVGRVIGGLGEMAIRTPQSRAAKMVARRLKQAGVSGSALEALKASPKPEAIADIDSAGIQQLSRLVAQSGGRGAELARSLNVRQFGDDVISGAADRIEKDLLDAGIPSQTTLQAKAGLDQIKSTKISPLYEEAHKLEVPQSVRQSLKPLFDRPAVVSAIPAAKRLAANQGVEFSGDAVDNLDYAGFDYIQRILMQNSRRAYNSGRPEDGSAIKALRDEIVDVLKKNNKSFKQAFEQYGETMGNQNALEAGKSFRSYGADDLANQISNLTEGELHHFRVGVAQAIRDEIEKAASGRNVADVIANSKRKLSQIKSIFPESGVEKLEKALDAERAMAATRQRVLGGSQTFQTTAAAIDVGAEDMAATQRALQGAQQGGLFGSISGALGPTIQRATSTIGPRTSKALGEILFETDPMARSQAISRVQQAGGFGVPRRAPGQPPSFESQMLPQSGVGSRILTALPSSLTRGLLFQTPQEISQELGLLGE